MSPFKKFLLVVIGVGCLLSGIIMILAWWGDVVVLFRGAGGIVVAIAGIFLLYLIKEV